MAGATGQLDEVIGQGAFANIDTLVEKLNVLKVTYNGVVKEVAGGMAAMNKATSTKEIAAGVENLSTKTKKLKDVQTEMVDVQFKLEKAYRAEGNALSATDKLRTHMIMNAIEQQKATKAVTVAVVEKTKATLDIAGAYKQANLEYKLALENQRNLGIALGFTSKEYKAASARVKEMRNEFKQMNYDIGDMSGNVGNYAKGVESGLSKVWGGLRKIAYVLPGLGIAGIFNLAFDAIGPLIEKIDLFKSKSEEMVAIEKEYASIQKSAIDNAGKEVAQLTVLTQTASNNALSMRQRKDAVLELQKLYPTYFGQLSQEEILNGKVGDSVNNVTQAIYARAFATAAENKLAAATNLVYENQLKIEEKKQQIAELRAFQERRKQQAALNPALGTNTIDMVIKMADLQKDLNNLQEDNFSLVQNQFKFMTDSQKFRQQAGELMPTPITTKEENKKPKKAKEEKEVNRIETLRNEFEAEKLIARQRNADGLTTEVEYRTELLKIIQDYATKKQNALGKLSDNEKKSSTDFNNSLLTQTEQNTNAIEKYYSDQAKMMDEYDKEMRRQAEEEKKTKKEYFDHVSKLQSEEDRDQAARNARLISEQQQRDKDELERDKKLHDEKQKLAESALTSAFDIAQSISDAIFARQFQVLDARNKALQESYDNELRFIEQSGLSTVEKEKRKQRLQAETEAQQKQIDRDRITAARKQAQLNKAFAISEIIAKTAIAVMEALAIPIYGEIKAATAAVLGAAQLARVIATPLPQYFKGRKGGKAEFAEVNELGPEFIRTKEGQMYIANEGQRGATFLPEGADVIPANITKEIQNAAYVSLANAGKPVTTDSMQKAMLQAVDKQTNEIARQTEEIIKLQSLFGTKSDDSPYFREYLAQRLR